MGGLADNFGDFGPTPEMRALAEASEGRVISFEDLSGAARIAITLEGHSVGDLCSRIIAETLRTLDALTHG